MIRIITVGSIKEKYLKDGIEEYKKRLSPFTKLEIVETQEDKTIEKEGERILERIKDDEYIIALAIEGNLLSSEELASLINEKQTYGASTITFIIGGSLGLSDEVKKRANYLFSFGRITLPHQIARFVLLEQVYRAFMINGNHKYHK